MSQHIDQTVAEPPTDGQDDAGGDRAATVDELLLDQLATANLTEAAADLVIGAMLGSDELAAAAGGKPPARPHPVSTAPGEAEVAGAYLGGIEVRGFRGIGEAATLDLVPGPGLTLVVGRNGSGKSSFAEATEIALTGRNPAWAGRGRPFRDGWSNLHVTGERYVRVGLSIDGHRGGALVECRWTATADLDERTTFLQRAGQRRQEVSDLRWEEPMELYRPFLSYADLGQVLSGKPSEMHDSLYRVLGLGRLTEIETRLKELRYDSNQTRQRAAEHLRGLREALAAHPDARARQAETLLAAATPDLDSLDLLAITDDPTGDAEVDGLRALRALALPHHDEVSVVVQRLSSTLRQIGDLSATPAGEARALAELLQAALRHQQEHPDQPCPVCAGRVLDAEWAASAEAQIDQLTTRAEKLQQAHQQLGRSRDELRDLVPPMPAALSHDPSPEVAIAPLRAAWQTWDDLVRGEDVSRIAAEAMARLEALAVALRPVHAAAGRALDERHHAWRPLAERLRTWVATSRRSQSAAATYAAADKAVKWLAKQAVGIRNDQLKPLAMQATEVWQLLRQESNVDLGSIELAGAGPRRRVDLNLAVDGESDAALGVMSQGELHALALSLFLPRATMPASPFRFLVIDDPVQSMDPSKVYGLAQVLAQVAKQRQVIVFTHDDRLPTAVRHLGIAAHLREVDRRERSQVTVHVPEHGDPALRYLADARAVTKGEHLEDWLRGNTVCALVRHAIEARCHDLVFARGVREGRPHRDLEVALEQAGRTRRVLALALFGDAGREGDVDVRLRHLHPHGARLLEDANKGMHGRSAAALDAMVNDASTLVAKLGELR